MEDMLHFLNMPGIYMVSPLCDLLDMTCYNGQEKAVGTVVLSLCFWAIVARLLQAIFTRRFGLSSTSGMSTPTIEKTHAWLSFFASIVICIFCAPIIFSVLPDIAMKVFVGYANATISRGLGLLVTFLCIVILFFLLQGVIHGFLARRFVKGLGV